MHGLGEFFDELFEAVYFQGGAHDDEQVGFPAEISGFDAADVVAERVRFVIEYDTGSEGADFEGTG